MKHLGLVVLLGACLVACAPVPTLDELVYQANLSGDWSAVEQHERIAEKRRARQGVRCSQDKVAYCVSRGASKRCECVNADRMSDIFVRY